MKRILLYSTIWLLAATALHGQCHMDRHNTNWFDGWASCEVSESPNADREEGHWILYNFGQAYNMGEMYIWNTNDPEHLDWGMSDFVIDYSLDGENWEEWGSYSVDMASGLSTYEGEEGPDLSGVSAQYVLVTALGNHGGECYGLSEIRFGVTGPFVNTTHVDNENWCLNVLAYPNPFVEKVTLDIQSNCGEDVNYWISDALGKMVFAPRAIDGSVATTLNFTALGLPQGIYTLSVQQGNAIRQYRLAMVRE